MPLYQFTPVFFSFLSRGNIPQSFKQFTAYMYLFSCLAEPVIFHQTPVWRSVPIHPLHSFTCWKASKISFFQQVGEKVDAFWWNFQVASSIPALENRDRRFMSKASHVSHLSGSADPLTPLANLLLIINSWKRQYRIFNLMHDLQYPISLLNNDKLHCYISLFSLSSPSTTYMQNICFYEYSYICFSTCKLGLVTLATLFSAPTQFNKTPGHRDAWHL